MIPSPSDRYFPDVEPALDPIHCPPQPSRLRRYGRYLSFVACAVIASAIIIQGFGLSTEAFSLLVTTHATAAIIAYWAGQGKI